MIGYSGAEVSRGEERSVKERGVGWGRLVK